MCFKKCAKNTRILQVLIGLFLALLVPSMAMSQDSDKELFLVAQKAFEDGFYDVAMRYIQQLEEQYPQTEKRVEAKLLLGQCYFFKSLYLKAYETFSALLQYPEFKDATLFWLGETYLKGSDYKQAEEQYRQLIKVYPNSPYVPQAYYSLGWIYYDQDQLEEAKKVFAQLVEEFPSHQLSEDAAFKLGEVEYNLRNYESAIRYFESYVSRYPNSTRQAEVYFYIGESYYYQEDFLTAVGYYAQSAQLAYDSKLILMSKVSLGWSYIKLGKLKLAQQYLDEAYQLAQQKNILSDDVLLGQASLYSEMKEYARALAAYTDLIKMFPDSRRIAEAYLGKGNICYLTEDYAGAIGAYQKIIDLFSNVLQRSDEVEKAYFGLAWAHLKLGDIDASVRHFKTIKDKTTNRIVKVSALTQIGDAYQDVGQFDKAISVYDEILKDYPQSPYTDYAQYRQGIALLRMGNIEAATLSFQSLQANFPSSRYVDDIRYYLAVAYFKKGDWATAKKQISLFLKGSPKSNEFMAEAQYILALSNFNLLDYAEALKAFQRILKDYPDQTAMVKDAEFWIGKCYHKMGQNKEALKQFADVIQKYPKSIIAQDSLMWLGDNALESGQFDLAIQHYQRLLEEFPGNAKLDLIYFELGQAYQAKGEIDEAVNAFKKINNTAPPELYAKARLAIADIFAQDVDPTRAMETYQGIIAGSPEFQRDAYFKIAEIHKRNGEYAQAASAYRNALNAKEGVGDLSSAQLQFSIADMHELLNERDRAVEEYLKIAYLYADKEDWVVKAYLRVARIFEDNEQWADARMTYQKVLKYDTEELKFVQERLEWIEEHVPSAN